MGEQIIFITVISIFCITVIFGLFLTHIYVNQLYKGLDYWTLAVFFQLAAFIMNAFNHQMPLWIPLYLGNGLLMLSLILFNIGLHKFLNIEDTFKDLFIVLIMTMIGLVIFSYGIDRIDIRRVIVTLVVIYMMIRMFIQTSSQFKRIRLLILSPIMFMTVFVSLIMMIRIVIIMTEQFDDLLFYNFSASELIDAVTAIMFTMFSFILIVSVNLRAVEELKAERYKLEQQSFTDYLTGLPNRRKLEQRMKELVLSRKTFMVAITDIDEFKTINDTYGHHIGDKVLAEIAKILTNNKKEDYFVARFGGDEFITVIEVNLKNKEEFHQIKNELETVQHLIEIEDFKFSVTLSTGISIYPKDANNIVDLIKLADGALYDVKHSGKQGIKFHKNL